jgi:ATP-dependent DNA helicase RecQ
VLCFNHGSAVLLKKRLKALVGKAAKGVLVATYHGAAMALAGISIRDMAEAPSGGAVDFDAIIREAIRIVKGETPIPGLEADEARDRLLAGYSHILVDEYQDIDEDQYNLVSVIAGRALEPAAEEEGGRLAIMAVGDDDQNIYTFRGANVGFIQRFQKEYRARPVYLLQNYRSSKHIIAAANGLIGHNQDRMKGEHSIQINHNRLDAPPGGRWQDLDPLCQGRVQMVTVRDMGHQAGYVKAEIERRKEIDPQVKLQDFAILARAKAPLGPVRGMLEAAGYPFRQTLEQGLPVSRIREFRRTLEWLESKHGETCRAGDLLRGVIELREDGPSNMWWRQIEDLLIAYGEESGDSDLPASWAVDRLYEFTAELRRDRVVGQGIFLGTIHGAKGMEFPHVFILDGGWRKPRNWNRGEEERRVMYVGMTRAGETLCLLKIPPRANPFLNEIRGDFVISLQPKEHLESGAPVDLQYDLLGLDQIYLDYGGTFPDDHPIHHHLAQLTVGSQVTFRETRTRIKVLDSKNICIAQLSEKGAQRWRGRLDSISEIRVVAMLERGREDPEGGFLNRIKAQRWELPVLEVVNRAGAC